MKKHWWIVWVIVLSAVGLAVWAWSRPTTRVEVVRPEVHDIRAYVEEQAVTHLHDDYLVSMPISGRLEPISLHEGDQVEADQVVARLETDDLRDRVKQAEQRLAAIEVQVKKAKDNTIENDAKVEMDAWVKAIDELVKAGEQWVASAEAVMAYEQEEVNRLTRAAEGGAVTDQERRRAELSLRKAQSDYQSDKLQLEALKTLQAISYIGPKYITDYIARKSFTQERLEKELAEATAQLDLARRDLGRTEVKSPIAGIVMSRQETQHRFLPAGTPLMTLGKLHDMEVIADVLTERAVNIRPDDPVEIFGEALPDGPVAGKVTRVYPAGFKKISSLGVEQQRVKVAIRFDKRPEHLGVAYRVYVRIVTDRADNAITVPRSCLFRDSAGNWQVMTVDGGKLAIRTIKVGLMNDDRAQVTDGLTEQDRVVSQPSRELTPGISVKVVQR